MEFCYVYMCRFDFGFILELFSLLIEFVTLVSLESYKALNSQSLGTNKLVLEKISETRYLRQ